MSEEGAALNGTVGDGEVIQDLVGVQVGWQAERGALGARGLHGGISLGVVLGDALDQPAPALLVLAPALAAALAARPAPKGAVRELGSTAGSWSIPPHLGIAGTAPGPILTCLGHPGVCGFAFP